MVVAVKVLIILLLNKNLNTLPAVLAKGKFELLYNSFNCTNHDPKGYVAKLNCGLSARQRTVYFDIEFTKDLNTFKMELSAMLPRPHGDAFLLFNLTSLEGCQFLNNNNQVPLIRLGRSLMDRYGNLPHNCPFRGGVLYYLRGFRLDLSLMPAFSFEADMLWWVSMLHKRKRLASGFLDTRIHMRQSRIAPERSHF